MIKNKAKFPIIDGSLKYAKVFESNRDMGNENVDFSETDGMYTVELIMDEANKNKLVEAGVPVKQGAFPTFKDVDGNFSIKLKRPHLHKYFKQKDEQGNLTDEPQVIGAPEVFDLNAATTAWEASGHKGPLYDYIVPWTIEDGFIGNGTKAKVKVRVEQAVNGKGKPFTKIQLESIGFYELVKYENAGSGWV